MLPRMGVTTMPTKWTHANVLCMVVVLTSSRRISGGGESTANSPVKEYEAMVPATNA